MEVFAPLFLCILVLLRTVARVTGVTGVARSANGYEGLDGAVRLRAGLQLAPENTSDFLVGISATLMENKKGIWEVTV